MVYSNNDLKSYTKNKILRTYISHRDSQVALVVTSPPANAGDIRDLSSIPGLERFPQGGHGNPLQCFCLENPHEQRSLVGYGPEGHTESDTTEAT